MTEEVGAIKKQVGSYIREVSNTTAETVAINNKTLRETEMHFMSLMKTRNVIDILVIISTFLIIGLSVWLWYFKG